MNTALRSLGSIVIGYATIVLGAIVFQDLLFGGLSFAESPASELIIGGGLTALSAVAGGYLLGKVAPFRPILHSVPLVVWLCIERTIIHIQGITAAPLWFDIVSGRGEVAGVVIGVCLYSRVSSRASS